MKRELNEGDVVTICLKDDSSNIDIDFIYGQLGLITGWAGGDNRVLVVSADNDFDDFVATNIFHEDELEKIGVL